MINQEIKVFKLEVPAMFSVGEFQEGYVRCTNKIDARKIYREILSKNGYHKAANFCNVVREIKIYDASDYF